MSILRAQVREFHRAFGHPIGELPCVPSDERMRLRARLITEEYFETMRAIFHKEYDSVAAQHARRVLIPIERAEIMMRGYIDSEPVSVDIVQLCDGLADLDYVVEGCRVEMGVDAAPIAAEVHRSNMAKVGGERRADGKTLKPAGWTPPDIEGCIKAQLRTQ